jgi:Mor family transcriptional regulator
MSKEKMRNEEVKSAVLEAFAESVGTMDQDDAVIAVAERFHLPYSYVRTLVSLGNARNDQIINAYLDGHAVEECAAKWALSGARIRQIVSPFIEKRDVSREALQMKLKAQSLMVEFERDLLSAVSEGRTMVYPYEGLIAKTGETVLAEMPEDQVLARMETDNLDRASVAIAVGKEKVDYYKNFGYNAYKELTDHRNSVICKVVDEFGVSATDVARTLGMTRDRIYGILHESGIRTREKLTKQERSERDISIRAARETDNMDVKTIADTFGLSRVTISTILNSRRKTRTRTTKKDAKRTSETKPATEQDTQA